VVQAIAGMIGLLEGDAVDLRDVVVDLEGVPDFARRVYMIAREIEPGATRTYGSIATELGDRMLAQEVGQALGRNPVPVIIPCHRVLAANGKLGGFSAPGGSETKRRMLMIEGALPNEPLGLFD
jgi:methylated-DNA-[protein]-cysteine S-methyltransferase